jgi:hypothetical protein
MPAANRDPRLSRTISIINATPIGGYLAAPNARIGRERILTRKAAERGYKQNSALQEAIWGIAFANRFHRICRKSRCALRTRIPSGYSAGHLPQFTNVTAGLPAAVECERQALGGQRLYGLGPSVVINLLLCLAGVSSLAVFIAQRKKREYLFLGLYLLLVGPPTVFRPSSHQDWCRCPRMFWSPIP